MTTFVSIAFSAHQVGLCRFDFENHHNDFFDDFGRIAVENEDSVCTIVIAQVFRIEETKMFVDPRTVPNVDFSIFGLSHFWNLAGGLAHPNGKLEIENVVKEWTFAGRYVPNHRKMFMPLYFWNFFSKFQLMKIVNKGNKGLFFQFFIFFWVFKLSSLFLGFPYIRFVAK